MKGQSAGPLTNINSEHVTGAWINLRTSGQVTDYQARLLEILACAKDARTEEERARFFSAAEELSERAREADPASARRYKLGQARSWLERQVTSENDRGTK